MGVGMGRRVDLSGHVTVGGPLFGCQFPGWITCTCRCGALAWPEPGRPFCGAALYGRKVTLQRVMVFIWVWVKLGQNEPQTR